MTNILDNANIIQILKEEGPQGARGESGYSGYSGYSGASLEIDVVWREPAIDRASFPPAAISGDRYIVNDNSSGSFSGQDDNIATYDGSEWEFEIPSSGWSLYLEAENTVVVFNSESWAQIGNPMSGYSGYSGFSGFSGYSGMPGEAASSGYSGYSGYSGAKGDSGFSGYSGFSGLSGYSGAPGSGADSYTNLIPTPSGIGGITAGSTFSGRTMTQMWDDLLYPEFYPTLTDPSSTFTLTQAGNREIGEVISTLNFSSTFNRGSISPAYTTSGFRAGLPNTYVYTGTGLSNFSSTSLTDTKTVSSYTVTLGSQSWTGRVAYDEGEQPLSSKFNNYSTPLPAGQTSLVTRTITGVYPYFATTSNISTLTKQTLAAMNATYYQVTMVAESGGEKQKAEFPVAFSAITGIQFYNTVSSTWEYIGGSKANSLLTFTTSSTTNVVQGNTINYTRYTHNGATIGSRQLRFYTT